MQRNPSLLTYELVYIEAIAACAAGATYDETRGGLFDAFPSASPGLITDAMADACRDARKNGIEREDIDDSWF